MALSSRSTAMSYARNLGEARNTPGIRCASNLRNQKGETVIRDVKWQVGRQGGITPVAVFDPITLGGVQIARATIHNVNVLSALGIRIGSRVAIVRSGDVIPKITEVLEQLAGSIEIVAPTKCPDCGSSLTVAYREQLMTSHFCDNDICPGRIRGLAHVYC